MNLAILILALIAYSLLTLIVNDYVVRRRRGAAPEPNTAADTAVVSARIDHLYKLHDRRAKTLHALARRVDILDNKAKSIEGKSIESFRKAGELMEQTMQLATSTAGLCGDLEARVSMLESPPARSAPPDSGEESSIEETVRISRKDWQGLGKIRMAAHALVEAWESRFGDADGSRAEALTKAVREFSA